MSIQLNFRLFSYFLALALSASLPLWAAKRRVCAEGLARTSAGAIQPKFLGRTEKEARTFLAQQSRLLICTHGTPRIQLLAMEDYPADLAKVFLYTDLHPIFDESILGAKAHELALPRERGGEGRRVVNTESADKRATLLLSSRDGRHNLVTTASDIDLVGGEADQCQAQTIVDLAVHSQAEELTLHVNAMLSYIGDHHEAVDPISNRTSRTPTAFTLRQGEGLEDYVRADLDKIDEELPPLIADQGYRLQSVTPKDAPLFPHQLQFEKSDRTRPGPAKVTVRYE